MSQNTFVASDNMFVCIALFYLESSSRDYLVISDERVRLQCDIVVESDSGLPRLARDECTQTIIIEWDLPKFGSVGPEQHKIKLVWPYMIILHEYIQCNPISKVHWKVHINER